MPSLVHRVKDVLPDLLRTWLFSLGFRHQIGQKDTPSPTSGISWGGVGTKPCGTKNRPKGEDSREGTKYGSVEKYVGGSVGGFTGGSVDGFVDGSVGGSADGSVGGSADGSVGDGPGSVACGESVAFISR